MIATSAGLPAKVLGNLWKSSKSLGNFKKMFGNVCLAFGTILKNLRKSSESGKNNIIYIVLATRTLTVPLKETSSLLDDRNMFGSSSKVFGLFGNLRKFWENFRNVRERLSGLWNNFEKSSEILGKWNCSYHSNI